MSNMYYSGGEKLIEVGDVCQLVSGGPPMTVTKLVAVDEVVVSWFPILDDHEAIFRDYILPANCLVFIR